MASPLLANQREQILYQQQEDGLWSFKIREASTNASYQLEITDMASGAVLLSLVDWKRGILPTIKKSAQPVKLDADSLFAMRLLKDGEEVNLDRDHKWPEAIPHRTITMRRDLGHITWTQTQPSLVRAFAATPTGMHLGWIQTWSLVQPDEHRVTWDFRDHQGLRYVASYRNVGAYIQEVLLPPSWLVTGKVDYNKALEKNADFGDLSLPYDELAFSCQFTNATVEKVNGMECHRLTKDSLLKLSLTDEAKKILASRRYEILFFLNGDFHHEESQGIDPYIYSIPSLSEQKGVHFLTINYIDYYGNVASQTLPIIF